MIICTINNKGAGFGRKCGDGDKGICFLKIGSCPYQEPQGTQDKSQSPSEQLKEIEDKFYEASKKYGW